MFGLFVERENETTATVMSALVSLCAGTLAVQKGGRGGGGLEGIREDDRFGRHSRPLFLMDCDVPRWTSAQPGSLWPPAPPVSADANTSCTISAFRG